MIEEQITELIRADHYRRIRLYYKSKNKDPNAWYYDYEQPFSIEEWTWPGEPLPLVTRRVGDASLLCQQINNLIKNYPLEMCLTSPSEYIRECKKWYEHKKIQCIVE